MSQDWLKIDDRSTKCLGISLGLHFIFVIIALILMSPAGGHPEGELISITMATEISSSLEDEEKLEEEDTQEEVEPELEEMAEENDDALPDDDNAAQEYKDKKRVMESTKKRERQKRLREARKLKRSLQRRSKYGILKPRSFYGIKVFARRMIFVLDVSGSMDIREAKIQLKNAYRGLSPVESFNIIVYASEVLHWKNKIVLATDFNKKEADKWIDGLSGGGSTNIYGALEKAFQIKGDVEVIYFLTDGHPSTGVTIDPKRILSQVKVWNRGKNIVINSIGIGRGQDGTFLEDLAGQNNGRYYVR